MVAHQLAAAAVEDGRLVGKVSAVLLADLGGGTSDANTIGRDVAHDRDAAASRKIATAAVPVNRIVEDRGAGISV